MAKKKKYYVVWKGRKTGVYDNWDEVKKLINGYEGAKYKSFSTIQEAEYAFKNPDQVKPSVKVKKPKYYVVWDGPRSAIYTDWDIAKKKIKGLPLTHLKTFGSQVLAEQALIDGPEKYIGKDFRKTKDLSSEEIEKIGKPIELSLSVDAACNEMTGKTEYRGVWTYDPEQETFLMGPFDKGSNNIGEFLALVHALAFLKKFKDEKMHILPIYSDSRIAMNWVKAKKCRTKKSPGADLQLLISKAEKWLRNNSYQNPIIKWETKVWGEIPADFGRK